MFLTSCVFKNLSILECCTLFLNGKNTFSGKKGCPSLLAVIPVNLSVKGSTSVAITNPSYYFLIPSKNVKYG